MLRNVVSFVLMGLLFNVSMVWRVQAESRGEKEVRAVERLKGRLNKLRTDKEAVVEVELRDKRKLKGHIKEAREDDFVVIDEKTGVVTTVAHPQVKKVKGNKLSDKAKLVINYRGWGGDNYRGRHLHATRLKVRGEGRHINNDRVAESVPLLVSAFCFWGEGSSVARDAWWSANLGKRRSQMTFIIRPTLLFFFSLHLLLAQCIQAGNIVRIPQPGQCSCRPSSLKESSLLGITSHTPLSHRTEKPFTSILPHSIIGPSSFHTSATGNGRCRR